MKTEKFNYDLPEHLIAQYPSIQRADSKLLVALESIQHQVFKDIENYLDIPITIISFGPDRNETILK